MYANFFRMVTKQTEEQANEADDSQQKRDRDDNIFIHDKNHPTLLPFFSFHVKVQSLMGCVSTTRALFLQNAVHFSCADEYCLFWE